MNRRQFLASLLTLPLLKSSNNPPNIIFIMADDLGYHDLGCYGNPAIQTPNLDRLADRGIRYTQAYSPAPVCAPTRFCLMTGQNIGHSRTLTNASILYETDNTVAKVFRAAGYRTGIVGKWGINNRPADPQIFPLQAGFDYHFGYRSMFEVRTYWPAELWENNSLVPVSGWSQDLFIERALDWMAGPSPYFLYLPFTVPHVVQSLCGDGTGYAQIPSNPYAGESWSAIEQQYAAMVTLMDAGIGAIMDAATENTLIVFCSDNGAESDCGRDLDFHLPYALRGGKRSVYEGGIRVPLIIAGPGIAPGVSDKPISLFNVAGFNGGMSSDDTLYWAFWQNKVLSEAVRLGDWKGIRHNLGPLELYHLSSDPGEAVDRAGDESALVEEMGRIMSGYCVAPKRCYYLPVVGNEKSPG